MILNLWQTMQGVDIHSWFWAGALLLGMGCIFFLTMAISDGTGHDNHFTTSFFINLIACTTYIAMAFDLGKGFTGDGHVFYYARYIDWILTTPLLLLNLCMIATFNVGRKSSLVAGLIGLDLFMIGTGLIAAMTMGPAKWTFFGLSCLAFLLIVFILWDVLRAEASRLTWGEWVTYNRVTSFLTVLWMLYPVVFVLGSEGLSLVSLSIEGMLYMALDISAKTGFGLVLLSSVRKFIPKQAEEEFDQILVTAP